MTAEQSTMERRTYSPKFCAKCKKETAHFIPGGRLDGAFECVTCSNAEQNGTAKHALEALADEKTRERARQADPAAAPRSPEDAPGAATAADLMMAADEARKALGGRQALANRVACANMGFDGLAKLAAAVIQMGPSDTMPELRQKLGQAAQAFVFEVTDPEPGE